MPDKRRHGTARRRRRDQDTAQATAPHELVQAVTPKRHQVAVYRLRLTGRPTIARVRTVIKTHRLTLAGQPNYSAKGAIPIVDDGRHTPAASRALQLHCVLLRIENPAAL
jgi:hypothetical protein